MLYQGVFYRDVFDRGAFYRGVFYRGLLYRGVFWRWRSPEVLALLWYRQRLRQQKINLPSSARVGALETHLNYPRGENVTDGAAAVV